MIYKTTSIGVVIAKIYRDFKPNNSSWIADAYEMIGEAIIDIGKNMGFEDVKTPIGQPLTVSNHRLEYPCAMEALYGVEFRLSSAVNFQKLMLGADVSGYGISCDDPAQSNLLQSAFQYYQTNVNYMVTSFTSGQVLLHYKRMPLDKNNLPLILDSVRYREALVWYVVSRMLLGGTIVHPDPKINFEFADNRWETFKAKAQNEYNAPSIDAMQRFMHMWTRQKFDMQEPDRFFKGGEVRDGGVVIDDKFIFDAALGEVSGVGDEVVIFE